MTRRESLARLGLGLGAGLASACEPLLPEFIPPPADLGTFPYHPLVYHLDLSILAYQIHAQSLIWPIDPFYEEHTAEGGLSRDDAMARVRAWTLERGAARGVVETSLDQYRGPGVLAALPNNPSHDPIITNYARIHPWRHALVNGQSRWAEYRTPGEITGQVADVRVSYRRAGGAPSDVVIAPVPAGRDDRDADAADILVAFEGGTGDKGEADQPHSQSLMGFVLLRRTDGARYDIHISFRGSRSGSAVRAAFEALNTEYAGGNPDWITDLGYFRRSAVDGVGDITSLGAVHRGFARSMQSILPCVFAALTQLAEAETPTPPTNIYVTGHSLGGALAQHFVSAVLLGDHYGPSGGGPGMAEVLSEWPWDRLKLVTFGAPRCGDQQWAYELTTAHLQSPFFDTPISPYDPDARYVTDPGIVTRLHDASRPCGFRVLASNDPITTEKIAGGSHVGKTVYVNGDLLTGWFLFPAAEAHEPARIRSYMTDAMGDSRTPMDVWAYHDIRAFVPAYDPQRAGAVEQLRLMGEGLIQYYEERGLWFDSAVFEQDLDLLLGLLS